MKPKKLTECIAMLRELHAKTLGRWGAAADARQDAVRRYEEAAAALAPTLADEIDRSHEFIREVAWRFSEHAAANWSGPDVLAHVADFFGITVAQLNKQMEDAARGV